MNKRATFAWRISLAIVLLLTGLWLSWVGWNGSDFHGLVAGITGILLSPLLLTGKNWARWIVTAYLICCFIWITLPLLVAGLMVDKFYLIAIYLYAPATVLHIFLFFFFIFFGKTIFGPNDVTTEREKTTGNKPNHKSFSFVFALSAPMIYGLVNIIAADWFRNVLAYEPEPLFISLLALLLGIFVASGRSLPLKTVVAGAWIFFIISVSELWWTRASSPLSHKIIPMINAGGAAFYLLVLRQLNSVYTRE